MKTLNAQQYALLVQVLEYIYEHESSHYDEYVEEQPESSDSHIYAIAKKLGESIA